MAIQRNLSESRLFEILDSKFHKKFSAAKAERLKIFSRRYFASTSDTELNRISAKANYKAVISAWDFIQRRDSNTPQISIIDSSTADKSDNLATTIYILLEDMPFLVDSIRQSLTRSKVNTQAINNTVIYVSRGGGKKASLGRLSSVYANSSSNSSTEALAVIQCSYLDEEQSKQVEAGLRDTLKQVGAAVSDFPKMLLAAQQIRKNLLESKGTLPVSKSEKDESVEFLSWLIDNHFTFLGYEEYKVVKKGDDHLLLLEKGSRLGVSKYKKDISPSTQISSLPRGTARLILRKQICSFAKSATPSKVHRPAHYDYVLLKEFDSKGEVYKEHRFLGLYTSAVYFRQALDIPLIRTKVSSVLDASGFSRNGHDSKNLLQVINVLPRDELFQITEKQLLETALGIARIQDSRRSRLFIRKDVYGKFFSCLIYVPKDIFNTRIRSSIQSFLSAELKAEASEYSTFSSESNFTRVHVILRVPQIEIVKYDTDDLELRLIDLIKPWDDRFSEGLLVNLSEKKAAKVRSKYLECFPASYKETYSAESAIDDINQIETLIGLDEEHKVHASLSSCSAAEGGRFSFRIFSRAQQLHLSDVAPIMENLGLNIISEKAFELLSADGYVVWLHDFSVFAKKGRSSFSGAARENFEQAFIAIWKRKADDDGFIELVLAADLNWRDVSLLRAYAAYLKQTQFGYSTQYVAETLTAYHSVSKLFVDYFYILFEPEVSAHKRKSAPRLHSKILSLIDEVNTLSEDSVLRALLELISATLRSNYFQHDTEGQSKSYISVKMDPSRISHVPLPKPAYEIFVFSRQVEGVHLRGGKVARGGLRWSDRLEDYRTEVLGLVKAQQVKNSVIVPVGAKGGFVVKQDLSSMNREQFLAAGIECYRTFICGLLDITDNRTARGIVSPPRMVRRDDDDPYLVVAADKGTATFSDIANGIAAEYDFWMGDGFASGGSNGYDHKQMGITARGAWVSVQRHFREMGIDIQSEDFSVVGIGDMSGDVFGNGMLLSHHICLLAAFNHIHIFIDPSPDSASSYKERKRLFIKAGSSWSDYKADLISKGGGVFSRSQKSIPISAEMRKTFDIVEATLTPDQLISRLLLSPVDLIWNGGIGTYVKASSETHSQIGDRNNDGLRVDARDLRCKVVGEGGNLGLSQMARIEYGLSGGVSLTDFVDNSAGVDCSDHEVNIKIVLNRLHQQGKITESRRIKLLESMTDDIAELVLANNYEQVQAIGMAHRDVEYRNREYADLVAYLESKAGLNRALEFMPNHEQFEERSAKNEFLTRPELSVLTSYTKMFLKQELLSADYINDKYLDEYLFSSFPKSFGKKFEKEILQHPLRSELSSTQLANTVVNLLGPSVIFRMTDSTGASVAEVVRAAVIAKDIFQIEQYWYEIETLNFKLPCEAQDKMMAKLVRLLRRTIRWLLRNHRQELRFDTSVRFYQSDIKKCREMLPQKLPLEFREMLDTKIAELVEEGVPQVLAGKITQSEFLFPACSFVEIKHSCKESLSSVIDFYYATGEELKLNWLGKVINQLRVANHWQALARETYLDDLSLQQQIICSNIIRSSKKKGSPASKVKVWVAENEHAIQRIGDMIQQLQAEGAPDYSMVSVVLRELNSIAAATKA